MRNKEERIRQRAHQIWQESGRPEGQQEEHWRRAELEIEEEAALTLSPRGTPEVPETEAPGAPPPIGVAETPTRGGAKKRKAP